MFNSLDPSILTRVPATSIYPQFVSAVDLPPGCLFLTRHPRSSPLLLLDTFHLHFPARLLPFSPNPLFLRVQIFGASHFILIKRYPILYDEYDTKD